MQRLVALVPSPRQQLIRFQGVLAPVAKLRALVVPKVKGREAGASGAAILETAVIERILTHLGLQARAPPGAGDAGTEPLPRSRDADAAPATLLAVRAF